jgi:hypothetical protein
MAPHQILAAKCSARDNAQYDMFGNLQSPQFHDRSALTASLEQINATLDTLRERSIDPLFMYLGRGRSTRWLRHTRTNRYLGLSEIHRVHLRSVKHTPFIETNSIKVALDVRFV